MLALTTLHDSLHDAGEDLIDDRVVASFVLLYYLAQGLLVVRAVKSWFVF